MSAAEAYSGDEGFISRPTRPTRKERHQQQAASRLAGQVLEAVGERQAELRVTGTWRDLWAETQDPEVYANVATQVAEHDVVIEAHRFSRDIPYNLVEGARPVDVPASYDVVTILSVGGVAVAAGESEHDQATYVEQVYPPSYDDAGPHNMSLRN